MDGYQLGNDFVPTLPSLDIYDKYGGLDRVVHCYKEVRRQEAGFLTSKGTVNPSVFHQIMKEVEKDELHAYSRIRVGHTHTPL